MDREAWNKRDKQHYKSEDFVPKEGDPVTVSGGCASASDRRRDVEEEFEGGSGYPPMTEKILTRLPISQTFKAKRDTLISMDEDPESFIRNEVRIRIEQFVVAEKLAETPYYGVVKWEQPATTWDMFKHEHSNSWWLGWLVRRRPVHYRYYSQSVAILVERYAAYPDANVQFPHLGKPVPIEIIKEK